MSATTDVVAPPSAGPMNPPSLPGSSAAPKCKNCGKTAYHQESISYDQQTYHKSCFRCTNCTSVVSLGKVAMIQGDLYCKTCFVKMFKIKGTYHVFGTKTLPSIMRDAEAKGHGRSQSSAPAELVAGAAEATSPTAPRVLSPLSRQKICAVDDCNKPRAPAKSWCAEHVQTQESFQSVPGVEALFAAIASKNVNDVRKLIEENGVNIALEQFNKKTAIEFALGEDGSPACGEAILEAVTARMKGLEEQVAVLKDAVRSTQ